MVAIVKMTIILIINMIIIVIDITGILMKNERTTVKVILAAKITLFMSTIMQVAIIVRLTSAITTTTTITNINKQNNIVVITMNEY